MARSRHDGHPEPTEERGAGEKEPGRGDAELARVLEQYEIENEDYDLYSKSDDYAQRLEAMHAAYAAPNEFNQGDFVQWKPHMRNRRFPFYGRPAIVVEVLDAPLAQAADGELLDEPANIRLGVLHPGDEFNVYLFNSNRFTNWTGAKTTE
ncbi:hypothetical protein AB0O54_06240 [Pseudarthrobacter oxydans]|uniref:hypothetical protein n=1 Tax=Pseudarthrobacter oxydans TaxID=1671 RepID=UPI00343855A2